VLAVPMATTSARLTLPAKLEATLIGGHPWVYRDQVPQGFSAPIGTMVEVRCGKFSAWALWDPSSALALRVYSRIAKPDVNWYRQRVSEAWQLRAGLRLQRTNAFRWIYGEGDGLPGIIVDHYAGLAVVVCDTPACDQIVDALVPLLVEVGGVSGVVRRRRGAAKEDRLERLWGAEPPATLVVEENGLRLRADLVAGQKTGLFLDHRENRATVERVSKDARVLNLFAYSGAFSLYALRGGAREVVSVDVAPGAAEDAAHNVRLNGFDESRHHFEVADVFDYLERARLAGERFDVIVCDPPSFARNNAHLDKALKAYVRVNAAGMKLAAPGALYAGASCTGRVTPHAFKQCLAESARRSQRRMQVVHESGQPVDHPELLGHPEGRYLKFVMGRLLPRA